MLGAGIRESGEERSGTADERSQPVVIGYFPRGRVSEKSGKTPGAKRELGDLLNAP